MSETTAIAWTDATWNPVRGCTKVSAGCKNCYAERFAERFRGVPGHPFEQGFDVRLVPEALDLPFKWRKPRRVFVNSMSDLFHEAVPFDFIDRVFAVMASAGRHTFQVLTKRAERMRAYCERVSRSMDGEGAAWLKGMGRLAWPLPNVWLGVSVEDQRAADERIPALLATPAAVRFLSCEPLLGPVDLGRWLAGAVGHSVDCTVCCRRKAPWGRSAPAETANGMCDRDCEGYDQEPRSGDLWPGETRRDFGYGRPTPDWVIVGGESGPDARPMFLGWARGIVEQCKAARVACFVKQLGAAPQPEHGDMGGRHVRMWRSKAPSNLAEGLVLDLCDRKGGDPSEWPEALRVRQFPEVAP